jgi:hypothetical protein
MSYFDDASLVLIPSGYKNAKVYSVKPTDGTGDLTFTRASNATRVASNGLIEKVRTNLILQSEAFNTTWLTNAAPTITANNQTAPNGTLTADTIAATSVSSGVFQLPVVSNGVEHSFSVYIKNITSATNIQIGCDTAPSNATLNFNAVTGAIVSTGAGLTGSSVTNAGNGWYRVSGTYVSTGVLNTFIIFGTSAMTFAAWGAQFETGVTTDYIPTTTAAVSVGIVSGLPRLDYLGSTCPRLLLEPQRTNSALYSEQFNNAYWGKDEISVTANNSTAPDNTISADKIIPNTTASAHHLTETVTGAAHSFSVFAKAGGYSTLNILYTVHNAYATFNLSAGTVTETNGTATAKIENYGNGWYRCTVTTSSTTHTEVRIYAINGTTFADRNTAGNGTNGIQLWGAQLEVGAYPTSYIPTLGASVTRVADACSKTGISSLIGQTAGVMFIDFNKTHAADSGGQILGIISDNAAPASNRIQLVLENNIVYLFASNPSGALALSSNITIPNGKNKIAVSYGANGYKFYVNGVQEFSNATTGVPSMQNFHIGSYPTGTAYMSDGINQALLFTTQLSNAQMAELTAL